MCKNGVFVIILSNTYNSLKIIQEILNNFRNECLSVVCMIDELLEKISNIEKLLNEIDAKIDNFLGFEELTEEEKEEIRRLREEVRRGDSINFKDAFSD